MRTMTIIITSMSQSLLLNQQQPLEQQQVLLLQLQQHLQLLLQPDRPSGQFLHSTLLLSLGSGGRNQLPIIKFPKLSKLDTTLTRISITLRSVLIYQKQLCHDMIPAIAITYNNDNSLILLGCAKNV